MDKILDVKITKEEMRAIGARIINWNGGVFSEYYLPITGDGRGLNDRRICVRFGEHPWYPVLAWLFLPSAGMALEHVKTIEQFKTLYTLLTGKEL